MDAGGARIGNVERRIKKAGFEAGFFVEEGGLAASAPHQECAAKEGHGECGQGGMGGREGGGGAIVADVIGF